jgi:outer membrane protein assembly factor BamB
VVQSCRGAATPQVRLFDGFDGTAHWSRDLPVYDVDSVELLGADGLLTVRVDGEVRLLSPTDGAVLGTLPVPAGTDDVQARSADSVLLVRGGGTLTAVDAATGAVRWQAPATGLPAAPTAAGKDDRTPAVLLVPDEGGFAHRDPATGAELTRSDAADVPAGGLASAIGPVVVLRLPDRVLAYR